MGIKDTRDGKVLKNTSKLFAEIGTELLSSNYNQFCNEFGVNYGRSQSILKKHHLDHKDAIVEVLSTWESKGNATRAKLESALKKAENGVLCSTVAKHFAKGGVHEEEESDEGGVHEEEESDEDVVHEEEESDEDDEESDEDAVHEEEESGEDEEESDEDAVHEEEESDEDDEESDEDDEESDEDEPSGSRSKRAPKKATQPSQRGSTLNIIASGNAKVKGNSMTGSVINMTTKNYAAGASKSQGQGRKRKATGSKAGPSGGKKKTKKRR